MAEDVRKLVGQVTELNGRAIELTARLLQDLGLLKELQRDVSTLLAKLWDCGFVPPAPAPATAEMPRIIRLVEVRRLVGLASSTIWKMVADGRFPTPRRLGPRSVGWLSSELDTWVKDRPGH